MIRLGIGHLLSYCKRFFERQFHEQKRVGESFASRIDEMVDRYLSSGMPAQHGHPTVAWCAEQFNFTPNYFGELVKREMHITAQEYISSKIVAAAQALLRDSQMSIGEIAEELGFAYSNHFTRMFRRRTGISPLAFRKMQNKREA
jgi:AraC family transcriptional regulator, transcriptional activator of pobA